MLDLFLGVDYESTLIRMTIWGTLDTPICNIVLKSKIF
jgi:hypothetical protein